MDIGLQSFSIQMYCIGCWFFNKNSSSSKKFRLKGIAKRVIKYNLMLQKEVILKFISKIQHFCP